ncbi:MAG TPA: hypothetical protein VGC10_00360 [Sphingomonas sp.]
MNRLALAALALLAAGPAAASADTVVTRINAAPARDGWFVCDAVSGPYALFAGKPDGAGTSLITLLDRRSGRFDTQAYQVGAADPGAGQIHWSLSRGGKAVGGVHGVDPGMIEGGAGVPPIVGVELGEIGLDCRFLAGTRFIGLDSRRTVVVTEDARGLTYRSFDYRRRGVVTRPDGVQRSNVPTLTLGGGSEIGPDPAGFRFARAGYRYTVAWPAGAAIVSVMRGGRPIGIDRLVGFSFAPSPGSQAATPGADAVWTGRDLDACRAGKSAAAIDACLVATMRRTGASAAAIAFTKRLIAKNDSGYISAWREAGPIGIATVTYPFRANTNQGTMLIPATGDPIDADGYDLTAADKARADYRAAQAQHPDAFPVPPGDVAVTSGAGGGTRILVTTATADCHACAPNGSIVVAYDFDAAGRFLRAGLVMVA